MDSLKDGAESVKDEVVKRMRSPFVGALVIAWCVVNYEFIIVVFSEGNYADKIGYIARRFFNGTDILHSFGKPLLIAAVSTAALPLVNLITDLWSKLVDVAGSYLTHLVEKGRLCPDQELRELARKRRYEFEAMRRYARDLLLQNSKASTQLFMVGQTEAQDLRKLAGLMNHHTALPKRLVDAWENVGLPVQGYRMLQMLFEEGALSQDRLLRDTKIRPGNADPGAIVLGVLHEMQLVHLIWEEGAEPSYELGANGKLLLEVIADRYPELFTVNPRPQA